MELTLQELRDKFEEIPEQNWIIGSLGHYRNECCCMFGHYDRLSGLKCRDLEFLLRKSPFGLAADKFIKEHLKLKLDAYLINDHMVGGYTQYSIKQRVLAFLDDMIKAGIKLENKC